MAPPARVAAATAASVYQHPQAPVRVPPHARNPETLAKSTPQIPRLANAKSQTREMAKLAPTATNARPTTSAKGEFAPARPGDAQGLLTRANSRRVTRLPADVLLLTFRTGPSAPMGHVRWAFVRI